MTLIAHILMPLTEMETPQYTYLTEVLSGQCPVRLKDKVDKAGKQTAEDLRKIH